MWMENCQRKEEKRRRKEERRNFLSEEERYLRKISGGMVSYLVNDTRSKLEKETCKYVGNEDVFEQMMKINEEECKRPLI